MRQSSSLQVRVINLRNLALWAFGLYLLVRFVDAIAITIALFAGAFLLATVLEAPIRWLHRHGISRGLSVALMALLLATVLGLTCYFAGPPLLQEVGQTVRQIPEYAAQLQQRAEQISRRYPFWRHQIEGLHYQRWLDSLGQAALPRIGRYSLTLFSGLLGLVLFVVITFYTAARPTPLVRGVVRAVPKAHRRIV